MEGQRSARHALEEMWRERLHQAEDRFHIASEQYRRLQQQLQADSFSNRTLQDALRLENEARLEYMRVLQIFTRLVLRGVQPPEEKRAS
ncbi:MAG TPA: hypothetical protein VGF16_18410 [Bryobacteraceae bacterium]|jgi:hypothetical protein